jgi:hypothetical protein
MPRSDAAARRSLGKGAVPNAAWLEHIPQLDDITRSRIVLKDGRGPERGVRFEHLVMNFQPPTANSQGKW